VLTRSAGVRLLVLALLLMTTCVLPLFLVAGQSAGLRAEQGWDLSVLGMCFSAFFFASAVASFPAGLLADRFRSAVMARLAVSGSAAVMVVLSVMPSRTPWFVIVGLMGGAGVFMALAQTCTSGLLARGVRIGRQGLAFGVRQMAIPGATLVAGVTVVMIDGHQWRRAFLWGVGLSTVMFVVLHLFRGRWPDAPVGGAPVVPAPRAVRRSALVVLAVAASAAGAAGSAIGAFYVEALLDAGHSVQSAGVWLVVGSVIGLLARPAWGWIADRLSVPAHLLILLMGLGAIGTGLLVGVEAVPFLAMGTLLAFAAGWAWTAILNFVAVRASPEAPAAASGIVSTGNFAGGAVGPLIFGVLAAHVSYAAAWMFCTVLFLVGAVLVYEADRAMARTAPVASQPPGTALGATAAVAGGARQILPDNNWRST
jgi:MFS family permease